MPKAGIAVYVTADRLREWRDEMVIPGRSIPFEIPTECEIWRGCVDEDMIMEGDGSACVACGRAMNKRCVVSCCEAHRMHVDCWAVTTCVTNGGTGEVYSKCAASVSYPIVGVGINMNALARLRSRRSGIKLERNRAAHDRVEACMMRSREWMGHSVFAHVPVAPVKMCHATCAMCGLQGALTDEGDAMLSVCGRHTIHRACYAYWREIKSRVGDGFCGVSECPGRFFSELSCIHALSNI